MSEQQQEVSLVSGGKIFYRKGAKDAKKMRKGFMIKLCGYLCVLSVSAV